MLFECNVGRYFASHRYYLESISFFKEMFVGPKTEDFFDDDFWQNLNLCWNALDNVKARKYTDNQCLFYTKPLLESGTLGTKCNSEVILPNLTKSYNDGKESDENENQIAMCTLR